MSFINNNNNNTNDDDDDDHNNNNCNNNNNTALVVALVHEKGPRPSLGNQAEVRIAAYGTDINPSWTWRFPHRRHPSKVALMLHCISFPLKPVDKNGLGKSTK